MNLNNSIKNIIEKSFIKSNLNDYPILLIPSKNPKFGDYQINGIMSAAKSLNKTSKDLASIVINNIDTNDVIETANFSYPGFINLSISNKFLEQNINYISINEIPLEKLLKNEKIIIDYSSPNLAKEMHVGHLRSTIIGDSINRIAQFLGANVIAQNHVGDWGTQFGMLVAYLKIENEKTSGNFKLSDLEDFYRKAKIRFENDEKFANFARDCVIKLQNNDKEILNLWHKFVEISLYHVQNVYDELDVLLKLTDVKGESYYNSQLQNVVNILLEKKIAVNNNGTKLIYIEDLKDKEGNDFAYIIQKKDGGFLYSTTDLACIKDNIENYHPSRIIYVVDKRQKLHFKALFLIAKKAFWLNTNITVKHVDFGTMMSSDGKPFKTRDGGTIKLLSLLEEAKKRAKILIQKKNPNLSLDEIEKIAKIVGVGAIKYADLVKNRSSDYVFNWDSILSFEGNTAPYIQYAYTRIFNLLKKSGINVNQIIKHDFFIEDDIQKKLSIMILQFEEVLNNALEAYYPHYLANHLYNISTNFNIFYEKFPILNITDNLKYNRLKLVFIIGEILKKGLYLLGIKTLEKM